MREKDNQMSVRRRTWINSDGSCGAAWVTYYTDRAGKRRQKSFDRRRDAESFADTVAVDVRAGLHVPDSQSVTLAEAGRLWLDSCEAAGLERATLVDYRRHLELHIIPLLGAVKISQLTVPAVRGFADALRKDGTSPAMVRKLRVSLSAILTDALERGLVAQNVIKGMRKQRRGNEADRHKSKLKVGVDIPTPNEVRTLLAHLEERWRPLFLTAIFTGLRASELRGLRWDDVDLKRGEIHVRQRADRYRVIGRPKSESAERSVPLLPMVVNVLREHRLACPKGEQDLVFANDAGNVYDHASIIKRGLVPLMVKAGIVDGNSEAKYTGLHALRHFYASWCINRKIDGGLELPLKVVQARLGHASIQMTADTYGHLFPRGDDGAELAAAERAFLGG
jgi:integrase